jgi:hypothetical protein
MLKEIFSKSLKEASKKIKEEENESRDSIWFTDTFFIIVLRAHVHEEEIVTACETERRLDETVFTSHGSRFLVHQSRKRGERVSFYLLLSFSRSF